MLQRLCWKCLPRSQTVAFKKVVANNDRSELLSVLIYSPGVKKEEEEKKTFVIDNTVSCKRSHYKNMLKGSGSHLLWKIGPIVIITSHYTMIQREITGHFKADALRP